MVRNSGPLVWDQNQKFPYHIFIKPDRVVLNSPQSLDFAFEKQYCLTSSWSVDTEFSELSGFGPRIPEHKIYAINYLA